MESMQNARTQEGKGLVGAGLFLAAVSFSWLAALTPLLQAFEWRTVDLRLRQLARRTPASANIVLVVLDDESLDRLRPDLGRWPWPRAVFGAVLEHCSEAAVVGFDLLFTEPDWQWPERDQVLVEEVARQGHVVNPIFLLAGEDGRAMPLAELGIPDLGAEATGHFEWPKYSAALLPFDALRLAGAALGHVNYDADPDGVARRYMLAADLQGAVVPSFAVAVTEKYLAGDGSQIAWSRGRVSSGARAIPVLRDGTMRLRYTNSRYPVYSLVDVLASWQAEEDGRIGPVSREMFRGKIVLIGSTATGLEADMQVTPVARALPGLVIHANAVDGLLRGATYRIAPRWLALSLLVALAGAPFIRPVARPRRMAAAVLALSSIYALALLAALFVGALMLPVSAPLLGMFISAGGLSVLYWHREAARRRQLEALERAKQEFTDMLVHDLKNRVSAIAMSLSMLQRQVPEQDESLQRSIRTSQASASRLLDQVYSLLDIRRMQEGRLALSRKTLDANVLLAESVREHQEAAKLLKIGLRVIDNGANPPAVDVDPDIFGRILGNLLWNALNHARRGSEVTLSAASAGPDRVEVVVANEGRNIPPELLETIFDSFVSGAEKGSPAKGPNFGLGLAFCRLACSAHGASIHIESPWPDGRDGVRVIMAFPASHTASRQDALPDP